MPTFLIGSLLLPVCLEGHEFGDSEVEPKPEKIIQLLVELRSIDDDGKRREQAKQIDGMIVKVLKKLDPKKTLAELEKNLEDNNDSVVYWTALSISEFGTEAAYLLPQLKKMLTVKEKLLGSKTSASSIRFAISKLEKK